MLLRRRTPATAQHRPPGAAEPDRSREDQNTGGRELVVLRVRELTSPTAAPWRVREVRMPDGKQALIFDRQGFARRVRHYPADWWLLDDRALWDVSWSR